MDVRNQCDIWWQLTKLQLWTQVGANVKYGVKRNIIAPLQYKAAPLRLIIQEYCGLIIM